MKKNTIAGLLVCFAGVILISCNDHVAAKPETKQTKLAKDKKQMAAVKTDGPAIGSIETDSYAMKLHRAFKYEPTSETILAGMKPKQGYQFIYLDVSLKNTGVKPLDGDFLFIGLKITDDKGIEYKKPAAAMASYLTENPGAQNEDEYNALWETFQQGEFHREIIYSVEVPVGTKNFTLSMPVDRSRKGWKKLEFSI